jgi:sulfatase modifying factor 1
MVAAAAPPGDAISGDAASAHCPDDMVLVDTRFCPDIDRRCTDMENERTNHLNICHAFAPEQACRDEPRRIAFCIDRYEYPNQKGARPVRMLDWYQAQATCESDQKRLCWASEWTAACEGPEQMPFPYGRVRNHDACNMDNFYIEPKRPSPKGQLLFYSKDRPLAVTELSRLDQSLPCGSMESCKSGFGVYDMTGNVDEWVVSDQPPRERSRWAGLKGGAWGHVRSQCRPMTTSHEPEFTYYFVGFRCCRDVAEYKWAPSPEAIAPPAVEPRNFAAERPDLSAGPGPSKAKFSRGGRAE